MTSFSLRALALLSMIIDHAGLALFPRIGAFRCIGRLAFPLYAFLLVQGYAHTHDLRAYIRRLLLLALLSEIPFDTLIFGVFSSPVEQNPLFSLLLSMLALSIADRYKRAPLPAALGILSVFVAAMAFRVSYGWLGIALCLWFYSTSCRAKQALGALVLCGLYTLSLWLSGVATSWVLISLCAMFSALPILLYNGRPGVRVPLLRDGFYLAYPLHMLVLIGLRAMRLIPPYFLD